MRGNWRWVLGGLVAVVGIVTVVIVATALDALGEDTISSGRIQALLSVGQALLTFALVTLTAFYVVSTQDIVHQMKVEREWTEARARQAQARLVVPRVDAIHLGEEDDAYAEVTIENASVEPVYSALMRLLDWSWRSERHVIDSAKCDMILPGGVTEPMEFGPLVPVPEGSESTRPPIEIEFSDSDGHRWRREPDGRLLLLDDNE